MSRLGVTAVLTLLCAGSLVAQVCPQGPSKRTDSLPMLNRPTVAISPDSGKFSGSLPFDERFNLSGPADSSLVAVAVKLIRLTSNTPSVETDPCRDSLFNDPLATRWHRTDKRTKVFTVLVNPIAPSSPYVIRIATLTRLPDSVVRAAAAVIADSVLKAADHDRSISAPSLSSTTQRVVYKEVSAVSTRYSTPRQAVVTRARTHVTTLESVVAERQADSAVHRADSADREAFETFQLQYGQATQNRADAIKQLDEDTSAVRVLLDSLASKVHTFSFLLLPNDFDAGHYRSAVVFTQALPARLAREMQRIIDGQTLVEDAEDTIESNGHASIRHSSQITPMRGRLGKLDADIRDQYELFTIATNDPLVRDRLRADLAALAWAMKIDTLLIQVVSQEIETFGALGKSLDLRDSAALRYARAVVPQLKPDSLALFATTDHQFDDRASLYISADIGVLAVTPLFQHFSGTVITPYVGANFYPLAVNKKAPLSDCEKQPECTIKRFSATVGVTTSSVARTNVRDDLFGTHSLFAGVGYRWSSYTRATFGWLMYQTFSTDGAHTRRFNMTPAVSVSIDWDVRTTLGGLSSIFGGG
jgi:hypothetical protein